MTKQTAPKKLRVLWVSDLFITGGIEALCAAWAQHYDKDKINLTLAAKGIDFNCSFTKTVEPLVEQIYCYQSNIKYMSTFKLAKFIFTSGPYDIIHAHREDFNGIIMFMAWLLGIKQRLSHSHGRHWPLLCKKIKYWLKVPFRIINIIFANRLLACSDDAGRNLYGWFDFTVVKNGIDTKLFKFDKDARQIARAKLGVEGKTVFGNLARFTEDKNINFVVDIFAEILKINKNAFLLLAGCGPLDKSIRAQIKRYGIEDNVKILAPVADAHNIYLAMDCLVFPSLREGLGLVAIEAQNSGLPCYISDGVPIDALVINTKRLPLKMAAKEWAAIIAQDLENFKRVDQSEVIKAAGYGIEESAQAMQQIYLESNAK